MRISNELSCAPLRISGPNISAKKSTVGWISLPEWVIYAFLVLIDRPDGRIQLTIDCLALPDLVESVQIGVRELPETLY